MKIAEPRVECPCCKAHMYEVEGKDWLYCSVCNISKPKEKV